MAYKIENATSRIIQQLYNHGDLNKAVLASVRNAASFTSPRAQKSWPILMANLDGEMLSKNGKPTYAETAIYAVIRFYAIHQQGQKKFVSRPVDKDDPDKGLLLFQALANLRKDEDTRAALDRRLQQLLATTNISSAINSLTHLVEILKATRPGQRIDYPALAEDLFWFQMSYERANSVRLRWGQQYFRPLKSTTNSEGKQK